MPTYYTSRLAKDNMTFHDFALLCSRQFGACISMRDEPGEKLPPERFEPSPYHLTRQADAETRLAYLHALTPADVAKLASEDYNLAVVRYEMRAAQDDALRAKYEAMLAKVNAWTPPTPDHQALKDEMIRQLTESIAYDTGYTPDPPVKETPETWLQKQLDAAERELRNAQEQYEKEVQSVARRTAWIAALRASLNPEE